ncbi:uncharacterized protein HMPREF1120_06047 [Exophiala dermatitidis NIH/UT8656]|uniref:Uncharacterized protein n=1 Tax=Exophiala dermatitidis (strain ATCC 34100 / CBS 525.76 / NIH/UT8656) TaxID=858893 RepID=H6C314_EXODN|nr:uncharacterized protein HMPREF1120_06047 [Exophiala dermatitidis NIH/UT8656]EHY58029.1 hypothetical protein HMPREF1120_06047 [Exophiala dermatitidis NIH/UT8656]
MTLADSCSGYFNRDHGRQLQVARLLVFCPPRKMRRIRNIPAPKDPPAVGPRFVDHTPCRTPMYNYVLSHFEQLDPHPTGWEVDLCCTFFSSVHVHPPTPTLMEVQRHMELDNVCSTMSAYT